MILGNGAVNGDTTHNGNGTILPGSILFEVEQNLKRTTHNSDFYGLQNYLLSGYSLLCKVLSFNGKEIKDNEKASFLPSKYLCQR